MKIIISESQLKMLIEDENKDEDKKKESLLPIKADLFTKMYKKMLIPTFSKRHDAEVPNYKLKGADGFKIKGNLDLTELDLVDIEKILNEVIVVDGNLDLRKSKIKTLGRLEKVSGYVDLSGCKELTDLGNLKYVNDYLGLDETKIKTLGNLEYVGKTLYIDGVRIEDLSKLKYVGGNINLWLRQTLKSLGDLEEVGGYFNISETNIESLGELKKVGEYLDLTATKIKTLGNLEYVGKDLYIAHCKELDSFGELKYVGGEISMRKTPLAERMSESDVKRIINVKNAVFV
jgi:hypothetical protein